MALTRLRETTTSPPPTSLTPAPSEADPLPLGTWAFTIQTRPRRGVQLCQSSGDHAWDPHIFGLSPTSPPSGRSRSRPEHSRKEQNPRLTWGFAGGAYETRTRNPLLAKQVRYQLRQGPVRREPRVWPRGPPGGSVGGRPRPQERATGSVASAHRACSERLSSSLRLVRTAPAAARASRTIFFTVCLRSGGAIGDSGCASWSGRRWSCWWA